MLFHNVAQRIAWARLSVHRGERFFSLAGVEPFGCAADVFGLPYCVASPRIFQPQIVDLSILAPSGSGHASPGSNYPDSHPPPVSHSAPSNPRAASQPALKSVCAQPYGNPSHVHARSGPLAAAHTHEDEDLPPPPTRWRHALTIPPHYPTARHPFPIHLPIE